MASSFAKSCCQLVMVLCMVGTISGGSVQLTDANINEVLNKNELVLVNFYADWCRFSQMLQPVFDDAATKIAEAFPEPGKVALAKVDCDRENGISQMYSISKYPTLKLFRAGQVTKKEYRGQRSVDAFKKFIEQQLQSVLLRHESLEELESLDPKKRHLVAYLESAESDNYRALNDLSTKLRDDCQFHVVVGEAAEPHRTGGDSLVFRDQQAAPGSDVAYPGVIGDTVPMTQWATDKCVPLVREITFQNAEELTEEGLPFLILFHHPDDADIVKQFTDQVAAELVPDKSRMSFLTADGLKFTHPLHHLGKSPADLPVLAIDSFRHMYLFPHSPLKEQLSKPGLLKQFVEDLHSGKLHREFHHGPDAVTTPPPTEVGGDHLPKEAGDTAQPNEQAAPSQDPPESVFQKLKPGRNRYTVLRDEL